MSRHEISAINIAFLYVGTLMGAGFASGREIWQFFGVFETKSYFAVLMVTTLFILFGLMTVKISSAEDTTDIGKIIMPFENRYLENLFGYVTAVILFIVYIVMAAAGGALLQEQFGIHRVFGGILLMVMVIATTLGGFERISKNFKYIIPVLLTVVFLVCLGIIFREIPASEGEVKIRISPMTPNWFFSAVIYISYNMLAGIPIIGNSTHRAKSKKTAFLGAALGGLILGLAALVMDHAMLTDKALASASVLPILPPSRAFMAILNPSPSFPRRCDTEIRTFSYATSQFDAALIPILCIFFPTVRPGVFLSITNAEIPFVPLDLSVIANTTKVSAKPEFVVKIFAPLITYSSPSSTAFVCCPAASVPAFGSVSPKQPTFDPSTRGLSHFCFCSSVPKPSMQEQAREVCTEIVIPVLASILEISSMQRA
jgi:uncharacterized membrane protein YkvI